MQKCIVCNAESASKPYGDYKWDFWSVQYLLELCTSCGSVFTTPTPTDETLSKVYMNFLYKWYEDHYQAKYRDCKIRIEEYKGLLGQRVLDFGGGIGYFSCAAKDAGYISETYDPFLGRYGDVEGKWNTVVALHVLEHSNNLDRTIEDIKKRLEPGGNLIIAVPNLLSKGYREFGMNWVWGQPPLLHIVHFTSDGLKSLLFRHGFKVLNVSYHERWDANLYSDYDRATIFHAIDRLWGINPLNRFTLYRRVCALTSSKLRFKGLEKAMIGYDPANDKYSELQIIARLEK